MKRIRKTLPPGASQKPSTWTLSAAPRLENDPARVAPVKGLPAPGAATAAAIYTEDAPAGRVAEAIHLDALGGAAFGERSGEGGAGEGIACAGCGDGGGDFDEVIRSDARGGLGE